MATNDFLTQNEVANPRVSAAEMRDSSQAQVVPLLQMNAENGPEDMEAQVGIRMHLSSHYVLGLFLLSIF